MAIKVKGLDKSITKMTRFSKRIRLLPSNITDEIAQQFIADIESNHNAYLSSNNIHGEGHEIEFEVRDIKYGKAVYISGGSQLLYDEYGTGDVGQSNPHPLHQKAGMNPYNSGPTIFELNGKHYWYYAGSIQNGQKAGMFIYYAMINYEDEKARNIAIKQLSLFTDENWSDY